MGKGDTEALDNLEVKLETQEYWKFSQWFRKLQHSPTNDEFYDRDYLSAVEFDDSGRFLATGDKSGNIVILEENESKSAKHVHYSYFSEFQSHVPDFDFILSSPVDEGINQIKFGPATLDSVYLLTTNDKQIKLWAVKDTEKYNLVNWNIDPFNVNPGESDEKAASPLKLQRSKGILNALKVPRKVLLEKVRLPHLKKTYSKVMHNVGIISLGVTADKENFLSGDNLTVNLWDLNNETASYNVLNIKPENKEDLSEIISTIDCHPKESSSFLYTTNLGSIITCDLRQRALVDEPCQLFSELQDYTMSDLAHDEEHEQITFLNEVTQNISAAKFSKSGKYIISRDCMSVKIWDVAMERAPVETIYVHEYLRDRLYDMYSNDLVWDQFGMGISSKGDIVTGTYSNYFHIFDLGRSKDTFVQASQHALKTTDLARSKKKQKPAVEESELPDMDEEKDQHRKKRSTFIGKLFRKKEKHEDNDDVSSHAPDDGYPHNLPFEEINFNQKLLHCAWHPEKDAIAVAGQNNLYVYAKTHK